jgi:uracil phosphoribosyltransferase
MTILRDASTPRSEFIFYVGGCRSFISPATTFSLSLITCDSIDRLSSLVVEEALGMLEYGSVKVTTPLGVSASGMTMLQKVSRLEPKWSVYQLRQTLCTSVGRWRMHSEIVSYASCLRHDRSLIEYRIISGGPFVKGLRRVIRDVRIGALLIQSDNSTGEPLLFHTSLPDCVKSDAAKDTVVFLMDAQISTGAAAIMAIRVLLDHGIQGGKPITTPAVIAR